MTAVVFSLIIGQAVAEYFGVLKEFANPNSPLADSDFARGIVKGQTDPKAGGPSFKKLLASLFERQPLST